LMELRPRIFMDFRFHFPTHSGDCGKRKLGRTQPDQALRRTQRPSSPVFAMLAAKRRLRVAPRGWALLP
jgi:hypothetical protein